MGNFSLVYPMFAMVVLTFAVLLMLFRTRVGFVREGKIDAAYFRTYQEGSEPSESAKLGRHFSNLFEAPTLFYAACLCAMLTGQSDNLLVGLAWTYVAFRAVHAFIHIGANRLPPRIAAYFGGWIVLITIWVRIVLGLPAASLG